MKQMVVGGRLGWLVGYPENLPFPAGRRGGRGRRKEKKVGAMDAAAVGDFSHVMQQLMLLPQFAIKQESDLLSAAVPVRRPLAQMAAPTKPAEGGAICAKKPSNGEQWNGGRPTS